MSSPSVSVIITTRNEEKNIRNCLESIIKQTYNLENISIIIVDNDSNDTTVEIASEYSKNIFNVGPERSTQRNYGGFISNSEYLLWLDADMILSNNVVKECVETCESQDIDALYIPQIIIGSNFWIKVRNFERSFYNATCIDAVRFIRRSLFVNIGGFDQNLTGPEDWDLDRRINANGKTGIISSVSYHNEGNFNLRHYRKKKKYYFKDLSAYIAKWGKNDPICRKQLGVFYRLIGVFVENGKWKRLLSSPTLLLGMYVLRFFVGINYLWYVIKNNNINVLI